AEPPRGADGGEPRREVADGGRASSRAPEETEVLHRREVLIERQVGTRPSEREPPLVARELLLPAPDRDGARARPGKLPEDLEQSRLAAPVTPFDREEPGIRAEGEPGEDGRPGEGLRNLPRLQGRRRHFAQR